MLEQSENENPGVSSSDELLMALFKKGDEQAFRILFDRYYSHVLNFAFRLLASREESEDIAQETLFRVYDNKDRFDSSRFFRPWLFAIASRLASNKLRHRKRHPSRSLDWKPDDDSEYQSPPELPDVTTPQPHEVMEKKQTIDMVREALDALPEKQRTVVILARYEDMPYEEIGMVMGLSVGGVKSLFFRAKEQLRQFLARSPLAKEIPASE